MPFAFATGDSAIDAASGFSDPILLHKPFDFEGVKAVLGKLLGAKLHQADLSRPCSRS